jgi:hypothetical protein
MNKELIVRDLLNFLQNVNADLPVKIAMNNEYQWTATNIEVAKMNGEPYILISDET